MSSVTLESALTQPVAVQPALLSPAEAGSAWAAGALVADLRSADERTHQGELPDALHRDVLELDDLAEARRPVILLCADGRRSAVTAQLLLGDRPAAVVAAVAGGYAAWSREVWRVWGELLMAEPHTPASRFFRLLA